MLLVAVGHPQVDRPARGDADQPHLPLRPAALPEAARARRLRRQHHAAPAGQARHPHQRRRPAAQARRRAAEGRHRRRHRDRQPGDPGDRRRAEAGRAGGGWAVGQRHRRGPARIRQRGLGGGGANQEDDLARRRTHLLLMRPQPRKHALKSFVYIARRVRGMCLMRVPIVLTSRADSLTRGRVGGGWPCSRRPLRIRRPQMRRAGRVGLRSATLRRNRCRRSSD